MATVSTFFQNVRYNLRDFNKQDFSDPQLLIYLNRAVRILDTELMRQRSDWTVSTEDVTLSSGEYQMSAPTSCSTVRYIYIDQVLRREISIDSIIRMRILDTSSGEPQYWSQSGQYIDWDRVADQDYTCTCIYDKWTATLTTSSDMPYNSEYDNYLLDGTVIMANAGKKKDISPVDQQIHSLFRNVLMRDIVARNFKKRPYKMDY